jgi:selenocysteine lyase/cysteine desulfurase
MTEQRLKELRRLFPVTERYVYFNHAASGPLPTTTTAAMTEYLDRSSRHGGVPYQEAEAVVEDARALAARLMRVKPEGLAFVKNTSAGAIIAISSIEWQAGDNVVLMKDAFPSNSYPFDYLLPRVEKRYVTSAELASGSDCVYRLADKHTRAVALDWVHFLSGARADIGAIGRFCRESGIWFLVDVMQGLGAVDFDFGSLDADFVYAGGNKWLLGPEGIGLLWVNPEKLPALKPANLGWLSARWDDFNDVYSPKLMKAGASRFEEGTKNYPGIYGLRESMRILLDVGTADVEKQVRRVVDALRKQLIAAGFEIPTPEEPKRSAGIITCRKPGTDMSALFRRLKAQDRICSLRENSLRLAPHFYNTEDEAVRFIEPSIVEIPLA